MRERLIEAMGGLEQFTRLWSWRSHSPDTRAHSALDSASSAYTAALHELRALEATAEQVDAWTARFVTKWVAYMQAGGRTANPMVTGPARFPVERNRKALATEQKRAEEFWQHANGAAHFMRQRARAAERAAKSEAASGIEHKEQTFGGVRVIYNVPLDRVQLVFPGKPADDERAILKGCAFRWSPREGAWQRQLTQNGIRAAKHALQALGIATA
jgi:hypothetical protein